MVNYLVPFLLSVSLSPVCTVYSLELLDTSWLFNQTVRLLQGCQLQGVANVQIFTPDASSSYGAQWTRDFTFALGAVQPMKTLPPPVNVEAAVTYTFTRITNEGEVPDRVYADGHSIFSPGSGSWASKVAWDNMAFTGLLLSTYAENWNTTDGYFCTMEPIVKLAFTYLNVSSNGITYNSDTAPNCSWGFMDTVIITRHMYFVTLLYYESALRMQALSLKTGCGDTNYYQTIVDKISSNIEIFNLNSTVIPLFYSSDGIDSLPDVWGSAYMTYLGLGTLVQRTAIVNYLVNEWYQYTNGSKTTIWQEGQLRHLPQPYVWTNCFPGACSTPGTYQNGAFWATPLKWTIPAILEYGYPDVAYEILNSTIQSFTVGGIMEAINRDIGYTGVKDYVASGTNVLVAAETYNDYVRKTLGSK